MGSAELDALKLNKEFRKVLNQSKAIIFTGENLKDCKSWRKDLEDEVLPLKLVTRSVASTITSAYLSRSTGFG